MCKMVKKQESTEETRPLSCSLPSIARHITFMTQLPSLSLPHLASLSLLKSLCGDLGVGEAMTGSRPGSEGRTEPTLSGEKQVGVWG